MKAEKRFRELKIERKAIDEKSPARQGAQGSSTRRKPKRLKVLNLTFTVLFMNDAQMAGTVAVGCCKPESQMNGLVES